MTVFPQRPFFILYKKVQVKLADIDFSMSAKVGYEQIRQTSKYFLSETGTSRALIFGRKHLRMNLYQECSYHVLGVKTTPIPGGPNLQHWNKEDQLQNSSFLKLKGLEL